MKKLLSISTQKSNDVLFRKLLQIVIRKIYCLLIKHLILTCGFPPSETYISYIYILHTAFLTKTFLGVIMQKNIL